MVLIFRGVGLAGRLFVNLSFEMVQAGVLERGVLGGPLPHPRGLQRLPPTTQQSTIGREYYSQEEAGGGAIVWPPRPDFPKSFWWKCPDAVAGTILCSTTGSDTAIETIGECNESVRKMRVHPFLGGEASLAS